MKKINLSITGCLGRMGQQLVKSSKNTNIFSRTMGISGSIILFFIHQKFDFC